MLKWLNAKIIIVVSLLLMSLSVCAAEQTSNDALYLDRTKLVSQQTALLKNRLTQAQNEFALLQKQTVQPWSDPNSKPLLNQATLDIAVAKSNVDSIDIELSESQQTISRLEKDIQEVENQLNVFSMFGIKIANNQTFNIAGLRDELRYQKSLLEIEKKRAQYLNDLQQIADNTLQLRKTRLANISAVLKTNTLMRLKEQQAQAETVFQQQQSYWLQQLNSFYSRLNKMDAVKNRKDYVNLQHEIFYANENLNFTYLQMLIGRYQDQLQQFQIAISHNTSITLLNNTSDKVQTLSKQVKRVHELLKERSDILERHKTFLAQEANNVEDQMDLTRLTQLGVQYQALAQNVGQLGRDLQTFRVTLDKALQFELSARQTLPDFNVKAWLNLGAEIWLAPALTFQVVKSLGRSVLDALDGFGYGAFLLISLIEAGLLTLFWASNKILVKIIATMAEHELGHINLKRLFVNVLRRNLIDIFVLANFPVLFYFCGIPAQSGGFLVNLALVWIFFKVLITMARVCLLETVHDRAGRDVVLYHRLKWSFMVGGVITALTVLMHQLPVIYEVKDFFDRLFLLFILVVSVFLMRSWEILPGLILPHIDDRRLYLKRIVRLLGLLIPLILLFNTAIGLFGFVNLVLTVSWYESIFVLMLVGYLVVRGLLIDSMVYVSNLVIQHSDNGWLWTEAILKPLDKVLRIGLFLCSWVVLFDIYGWNQQSPVGAQLNSLLHYHIADMFNTAITLLSIIEVGVIVSVLIWAARWTREFVYRLLSAQTLDIGLRNSIAIFSQYMVILIGIFVCLRVLGIDFRALAVVAGAFAFGVGLGLRDLFNNFACGFLLLIERPVRVGDIVSVDTYEGEVTNIGSRAITIRTWDHMDLLVPNTEIFSKSFMNWTGKDHIIRTVMTIKTNRQDTPHDVQVIVHQVLDAQRDVLKEPAPEVFLKELSDSLLEFEVRYFINLRQVRSRLELRSVVLLAIWEAFERHGIQPPHPYQEIYLRRRGVGGTADLEEFLPRLKMDVAPTDG